MKERRFQLRLDDELYEFLKEYAKQNHTSMSQVVIQQLVKLKNENLQVQALQPQAKFVP